MVYINQNVGLHSIVITLVIATYYHNMVKHIFINNAHTILL